MKASAIVIFVLVSMSSSAFAQNSILGGDHVVIAVRAIERFVGILASIMLIYFGYRLLSRKRSIESGEQKLAIRLGPSLSLDMNGYGPGLACILVGATLSLFSILNVPRVDVATGKLLFFDRRNLEDIKNTEEYNFLMASKILIAECKESIPTGRKAFYCAYIDSYRKSIIGSKYGVISSKYASAKAKNDKNETLNEEEAYIFVFGQSVF